MFRRGVGLLLALTFALCCATLSVVAPRVRAHNERLSYEVQPVAAHASLQQNCRSESETEPGPGPCTGAQRAVRGPARLAGAWRSAAETERSQRPLPLRI